VRRPVDMTPAVLLSPLLAATAFAFACGSTWITTVNRLGHPARWLALLRLFGCTIWLLRRRGSSALPAGRGPAPVLPLLPMRGVGENPHTPPMLFAIGLVRAPRLLLDSRRSRRGRAAAVALVLLFDGSITFSGSRGALVGAAIATAAFVALALPGWRQRIYGL